MSSGNNVNIETRRVQRFGKSTLMVSLPAEWVKVVNLRPGDTVTIVVEDDNTLRVFPTFAKPGRRERRLLLKTSRTSNAELIYKILSSAYTLGYDRIQVEVVDGFLDEEQLKILRRSVKELIGAEIVEHMPSRVIIQIFVDPAKYSINGILTRMSSILRSIINYMYLMLVEDKTHYLTEIEELGAELNRINLLAVRQTFVGQIDRIYANTLNIKSYMLPRYRSITRSLTLIGESIVNSSKILANLPASDKKVLRSLSDEMKEFVDLFITGVERALSVVLEPNIARAFNADLLSRELQSYVSRFIEKHNDILKNCDNYIQILEFFDNFRRSATDIEVISDVSFDLTLEKQEGLIDLSMGEAVRIV
ncbi:MAG: phosphate uptake regulator PhoU [Sulfolobales archaeon]